MQQGHRERFLRAIGIMTERDLQKIHSTTIAIGGLGLGGAIFMNLVRMGFQNFHVADPDTYERTNVNRQRLAKESTLGVRKDDALIREARDMNPHIKIQTFRNGVNEENAAEFLEGADWVVDTVDVFALAEKLALNQEAAKRGLPVVSCGSLGFSAAVIVFDKTTPTFAEQTGLHAAADYQQNIRRFIQFLTPEIPDYMQEQMEKAMNRESHIPFMVAGVEIAAACAATEIAKQILSLGPQVRAPNGLYIDPVNHRFEIFNADFRARELAQKIKRAA